MKKIKIEITTNGRGIRFDVPGSRIFQDGGFDLSYSFDSQTSDRRLMSMALSDAEAICNKLLSCLSNYAPSSSEHRYAGSLNRLAPIENN